MRGALALVAIGASIVLAAPPAWSGDHKLGAKLFVEGRKLYDQKRFAEACAKLAESDAADPTVESLGLLASCHEELGKTATARLEYLQTAARAREKGDAREAFARDHANALLAKVPTILARSATNERGLALACKPAPKEEQGPAVAIPIGKATPIDPGAYECRATAIGRLSATFSVVVAAGEARAFDVAALAPDEVTPPPPPPAEEEPSSTRPILTLASGGLGLVGLGVGAVTGAMAIARYGDRKGHCDDATLTCDSKGVDAVRSSRSLAVVSTIGFGVGIAATGAFIVLVATAPKKKAGAEIGVAPIVSAGGSGAMVMGRF